MMTVMKVMVMMPYCRGGGCSTDDGATNNDKTDRLEFVTVAAAAIAVAGKAC